MNKNDASNTTPNANFNDPEFLLQIAITVAESEWESIRKNLEENMDNLRRNLFNKAVDLSAAKGTPQRFIVNSLGEVQGRGFDIDRMCARLDEKFQELERLRFMLKEIKKGKESK